MKTYCKNLKVTAAEVQRAYDAWLDAESGKKNRHRVYEEYGTPSRLIEELVAEIGSRTLSFRPIHRYERIEPTNGKVRLISVQSVKQQVVDYLIYTCLEDMFKAKIGYYQVAGMRGRGNMMALKAIKRWAKEDGYFAKSDIIKCYPSTSVDAVRPIYEKYVGSDDLLYCIESLFSTYEGHLEIGSFFSMMSMQLVLSFAYHHLESLSKMRRGKSASLVRHQVWQLDDFIVFSRSKRDLKVAMRSVEQFLTERFGLSIKPWKVCRISEDEPIDLVGYVVRPSRTRMRSRNFLKARRTFKRYRSGGKLKDARRVTSYMGYMNHADCSKVIMSERLDSACMSARRDISAHDRSSNG